MKSIIDGLVWEICNEWIIQYCGYNMYQFGWLLSYYFKLFNINRIILNVIHIILKASSFFHYCYHLDIWHISLNRLVHKSDLDMEDATKYPTPYGGRLEWTLPGGNKIIAHVKDKAKIRPKKRWSQVGPACNKHVDCINNTNWQKGKKVIHL